MYVNEIYSMLYQKEFSAIKIMYNNSNVSQMTPNDQIYASK